MSGRFRRFYANAGLSGALRSGLILLAFVVGPFVMIAVDADERVAWITVASLVTVAGLLTWLARDWIGAHPEDVSQVLRVARYGCIAVSLTMGVLREVIDPRLLLAVVCPLVVAMLGAYWWLYSDARVEKVG